MDPKTATTGIVFSRRGFEGLGIAYWPSRRGKIMHQVSNLQLHGYSKLSSPFATYTTKVNIAEISRNIHEAPTKPKWKGSNFGIDKGSNGNWNLASVDLPKNSTVLGSQGVVIVKYK